MTTSLALACLWALAANVIAMFPSRRNHWPAAYGLIVVGIPLLGYVTYENGPWWGLAIMVAGVSVLRWPVRHFLVWVRATVAPPRRSEVDE